jgi:hypothetical protein
MPVRIITGDQLTIETMPDGDRLQAVVVDRTGEGLAIAMASGSIVRLHMTTYDGFSGFQLSDGFSRQAWAVDGGDPGLDAGTTQLSDQLLDAVRLLDQLPHGAIANLLRRAAIEVRSTEIARGTTLEHIPVYSYHLLRRLGHAPIHLSELYGQENETALAFLISRGLASIDGVSLVITRAGRAIGEIQESLDGWSAEAAPAGN